MVSLTFSSMTLAAPDLSIPKAAALAFAKAVDAADPEATKAVVVADAANQEMAALVAELAGDRNKLREAVKAKFGDDEAAKLTGKATADEMAKQLESADVKEDGD